MSQVDVDDQAALQALVDAFFTCMIPHNEPGQFLARVRKGSMQSSGNGAGLEVEVISMSLGALARAPVSLPLHLEAVAANCTDGGEVIMSLGLAFAFLESVRAYHGAKVSMSRCPEVADDETADNVWLHFSNCDKTGAAESVGFD